MNVQVILNEDLPNLGRPGDVVRVRAGYARNYLLPRNLAVEANPRNLRAFEHQKRLAMGKREALLAQAMTEKQKVDALHLTLSARAGEEGKLFGSVTNLDLERALREQGFSVDRRKILLAEPIKQLGEYTVTVRLQPEVDANLKFSVTAATD
ncbi:MAG TPA: 50S ribosomal protein L9 [Candidatus Binataceae bacterium]|nr:50S ribosomal protein L9 [Candidatus Binataceae bacterium]